MWLAVLFFSIGYLINVFVITVLYHRGLAHHAVRLRPFALRFTQRLGPWLTGIDPKGWVCMHRLHHVHSDTELDPHSPHHWGVLGVAWGQLKSYERVLAKLLAGEPKLTSLVADIPFGISSLNRRGLWFLPHVMHLGLAVALAFCFANPLVGIAYFAGIMSHPVQGWMVNSLAHRFGYRNFATDDRSKNNRWVSYLVFGEGLQNNHHAYPSRACFAHRPSEVDLGFLLCRLASGLRLVELRA